MGGVVCVSTRSCPCQTCPLCWTPPPNPRRARAMPPRPVRPPPPPRPQPRPGPGRQARPRRRRPGGGGTRRRGGCGRELGHRARGGPRRRAGCAHGSRAAVAATAPGWRRGGGPDRGRGRPRVAVRQLGGRRRRDHVRLRPLRGHRRGSGAAAGRAARRRLLGSHLDGAARLRAPARPVRPRHLVRRARLRRLPQGPRDRPARGGVQRVPGDGGVGVAVPGRRHRGGGLRLRADPVVRDLERVRAGERPARGGGRGAGRRARAAPRPAR